TMPPSRAEIARAVFFSSHSHLIQSASARSMQQAAVLAFIPCHPEGSGMMSTARPTKIASPQMKTSVAAVWEITTDRGGFGLLVMLFIYFQYAIYKYSVHCRAVRIVKGFAKSGRGEQPKDAFPCKKPSNDLCELLEGVQMICFVRLFVPSNASDSWKSHGHAALVAGA